MVDIFQVPIPIKKILSVVIKKKTLDKKTCKKKNINCHKFGENYESKFESVSSTAGGELGSLI